MTPFEFVVALLLVSVLTNVLQLVPSLLGTVVLWYTLVKPKKAPMDVSNRIGHMRVVWFVLRLRDPDLLVQIYPFLTKDEGEVIDQ